MKKKFQHKWSISKKLTVSFTALISVILILILLLFYILARTVVEAAETQFLTDEIYIMQNLLKENNSDVMSIQLEVDGVPKALKDAKYHYYMKVYDSNKRILTQTRSIEDPNIPSYPPLNSNQQKLNVVYYTHNDKTYLLITGPIEYAPNKSISKYVTIALDITYQSTLLKKYTIYAVILYFVCMIGIYFLAQYISRNGLVKLYQIANVANQITFPNLKISHIDTSSWPEELIPIGQSYHRMIKRIEDSYLSLKNNIDVLAHELRTPLNNLLLEAEYTLSKSRDVQEYEKVILSSFEEYKRLSSIIESILFLAKHNNDYVMLEKNPIDILYEIKSISEYCQLAANEKNIKIQILGQATCSVNKVLFQRVIYNLIDNAIKYTHHGGNIVIKISEETTSICINIQDTGIGIPAQFHDDVFNQFFRVKNCNLNPAGLGLGLSIVKLIMNLHAGVINLTSEINKGTNIYLYFPLVS